MVALMVQQEAQLQMIRTSSDCAGDLDSDASHVPKFDGMVALARMTDDYTVNNRFGRKLVDSVGSKSIVIFYNEDDPMPYFRYDQLREGNFLCTEHAHLHRFILETGFRIDDPWDVLILEP
nr:hypothetical protein BaRGS_031254 [Batillaria attramentaria]